MWLAGIKPKCEWFVFLIALVAQWGHLPLSWQAGTRSRGNLGSWKDVKGIAWAWWHTSLVLGGSWISKLYQVQYSTWMMPPKKSYFAAGQDRKFWIYMLKVKSWGRLRPSEEMGCRCSGYFGPGSDCVEMWRGAIRRFVGWWSRSDPLHLRNSTSLVGMLQCCLVIPSQMHQKLLIVFVLSSSSTCAVFHTISLGPRLPTLQLKVCRSQPGHFDFK